MTSNCNYLKETMKLRLLLHEQFYTTQEIIDQICILIEQYFDIFGINYEPTINSLKIKIKKTNMKKNDPCYTHNTSYYYNAMNEILFTVFQNNIHLLENIMLANKLKYELNGTELSYLYNKSNISVLYNITTLLDNIIIINL